MISPSFLGLFHANTALEFCESYSKFLSNSNAPPSSCMDTEQLVEIFNSACCTALNTVALLKRKKCKVSSSPQPWFNASTRTLRQECRRAERRWKKDGLQGTYYRKILTLKSYLICLVTMVISVRTTFRTKAITEQHFLSALSYLNYR